METAQPKLAQKKRILVVDDELDFTNFLKLTLEMTGQYQVRVVTFATQVLNVAREFRPDLILLDCMMPVMDGGELASQLEADPDLGRTPFVFVTATVSEEQTLTSQCYRGARTYLPKPFRLDRLLSLLNQSSSESPACESNSV